MEEWFPTGKRKCCNAGIGGMVDDTPAIVKREEGAAEGGIPPHPALGAGGVAGIGQLNYQLGGNSATGQPERVAHEGRFRAGV